ncbi:MAG: hypothetical protein AB1Z23_11765 [Eubacteriales bacterium]
MFALILPSVFLFLFFYTDISKFIAEISAFVLGGVFPKESLEIASSEFFPLFGGVYHLAVQSKSPTYAEIWINLLLTISLLSVSIIASRREKKRTPLPIYFTFILLIHLVSTIYFLFAKDYFPYTATKYSELYIKQQVVIWLALMIVSGFVLGIIGFGNIKRRILLYFGLMGYSFIFGIVRFITFTYIISTGSSLYMASLFFTLGPLYDFLYFIFLYSIFVNKEIKYYGYGEGRYDWQWL